MGPRTVHPDELGEGEPVDVQDAIRVGNQLAESLDDVPVATAADFSDRVMAAVADEPTPGTTGFLVPLRRRGLGGLRASVRDAWAATRTSRPMLGRSAALVYVLVVVVAGISVTGAATLGGAGALGLLDTPTASPVAPTPRPPVAPAVPASPTAPPSTTDVIEPPATPMPSPTDRENEPEASDDHGGNSGPGGGGDDNSGRGGGGNDNSGTGGGGSGPGDDSSGPGGDSGSGGSDDGTDGTSGQGRSGSESDDSGSGSSG